MATRKKAARKAPAKPRAACSAEVLQQAAKLRDLARVERHGVTALQLRVEALESLVEALTA